MTQGGSRHSGIGRRHTGTTVPVLVHSLARPHHRQP
jgi:hypothetical protein